METMKVQFKGGKFGDSWMTINVSDYDPAKHRKEGESEPAKKADPSPKKTEPVAASKKKR